MPKTKPPNRRLSIHDLSPAERKWTRILEKRSVSGLPGAAYCRKRGYWHRLEAYPEGCREAIGPCFIRR